MMAALVAAVHGVLAAHHGDLEYSTRTRLRAHTRNKSICKIGKQKKHSTYGVGLWPPLLFFFSSFSALGRHRQEPSCSFCSFFLSLLPLPPPPVAQLFLLLLLVLFCTVRNRRRRISRGGSAGGSLVVLPDAGPKGTRRGTVCSPPVRYTALCRRSLGCSWWRPPRRGAVLGRGVHTIQQGCCCYASSWNPYPWLAKLSRRWMAV